MVILVVDFLYAVVARNTVVFAWALGGVLVLWLIDLASMRFKV